jgi:Ca2+/Na+ antiporter
MISNSKPEAGSNHEISVPESQGAIDRGGLFLGILFGLALVWGLLGCVILGSPSESAATMDFLKVYLFSTLDLSVLIVLMWKLFFSRRSSALWKVDLFFWFVFKLVCWGFLAITLKRLTNASGAVLLFGVGFVGVGPVVAGVLTQVIGARQNQQPRERKK